MMLMMIRQSSAFCFHSHLASFVVMEPASDEAWELPASPLQGGELPRVEDLDADASPSHDSAPQRRGRPAGILLAARLRQLRDRVLGDAGALPAVAADRIQEHREEPEVLPPEEECLMRYCEPTLGPPQQQLVAKAIAKGPDIVETDDLDMIGHFLGETPRICGPITGEARSLGISRRSLTRRAQRMAAMIHWGTRGWVSALCARLMREIEGGHVEPIACGSYVLADETPLPLRARADINERGAELESGTTQLKWRTDRAGEKSTKIVQSECWLTFVFRKTVRSVISFLSVPVTTPLHCVDSCTAEAAMTCIEEHLSIPLVEEVEKMFPVNFGLNTTDSGASMLKAEQGLQAARPHQLRLHMPCCTHKVSTVQGRAYGPIDADISGMISASLSCRANAFIEQIRQHMVNILVEIVDVIDGPPPPETLPHIVRQHAIIAMVMNPDQKKRIARIKELFHYDWLREDKICFWVVGGEETLPREKWAELAAFALFPRYVPLFPRSRWMKSAQSLNEYILLYAVHRVYERAVQRAIGHTRAAQPPPAITWSLPDSEGEEEPPLPLMDRGQAHGEDGAEADTEAHRREAARKSEGAAAKDDREFLAAQRCAMRSWSETRPSARLLIARIAMAPQIKLLSLLFKLGSEEWDKRQLLKAQKGEKQSLRILEAPALLKHFSDASLDLASSHEKWESVLHPTLCTVAMHSLAWSMLGIAACGVHQLIERHLTGYPIKIFWLLITPTVAFATELIQDPNCLKDVWSRRWLCHWKTAGGLISQHCLAILLSIALTLRIDIFRIECRHALVRRLVRGKGDTHLADLQQVSAEWLLARQRRLERFWFPDGPKKKGKKVAASAQKLKKRGRCKGKRAGGGGAFRRALGLSLNGKGHAMKTKEGRKTIMKEAHRLAREMRDAGGQQWAQVRREGSAGTASKRAGGSAFGAPTSRDRKRRRLHEGQPFYVRCNNCRPFQASADLDMRVGSGIAQQQLNNMSM